MDGWMDVKDSKRDLMDRLFFGLPIVDCRLQIVDFDENFDESVEEVQFTDTNNRQAGK